MAWKLGISTKSGTDLAIDVCDYFTNEESSGCVSGILKLKFNQSIHYGYLKCGHRYALHHYAYVYIRLHVVIVIKYLKCLSK